MMIRPKVFTVVLRNRSFAPSTGPDFLYRRLSIPLTNCMKSASRIWRCSLENSAGILPTRFFISGRNTASSDPSSAKKNSTKMSHHSKKSRKWRFLRDSTAMPPKGTIDHPCSTETHDTISLSIIFTALYISAVTHRSGPLDATSTLFHAYSPPPSLSGITTPKSARLSFPPPFPSSSSINPLGISPARREACPGVRGVRGFRAERRTQGVAVLVRSVMGRRPPGSGGAARWLGSVRRRAVRSVGADGHVSESSLREEVWTGCAPCFIHGRDSRGI
mmetsp:Transcript_321/g.967  ORF Transcript_321/g.967 Transcript_321/m.967 type:complete len:276 (-) Transcript_321:165-992(-)